MITSFQMLAFILLSLSSQAKPNDLDRGFTTDFNQFLQTNYGTYKFDRTDITWSCYGGYDQRPNSAPLKNPIIFIHGNSDIGVGNGGTVGWQTGFTKLITYLEDNGGYNKQDLYVTTWGPANPNLASQNDHRKDYVMFVRKFIEAVIEYTKADQVVIIGHSMGVTLARQAIIGGQSKDSATITYDVGTSLSNKISVFFGLAGANYGLVDCQYAIALPTCSAINGFSPSSEYMARINSPTHREGKRVYSMWSPSDDIIKYSCIVKGNNTCIVPGSDQSFSYAGFTHFNVRDNTGADILKLL